MSVLGMKYTVVKQELAEARVEIIRLKSELQAQRNILRIYFGLNPDGTRYIAEQELQSFHKKG